MDYICKSLLNIFLISMSWGAGRLTQSNKFQKSSYSEGEKGVGGGTGWIFKTGSVVWL